MATNQPPSRPWFRLPSIARPMAPTNPTPEPPAPQPRPPLALPTFRPSGQPQPQEPGAPPTTGLSSVPPSPIRRTSVPSSPVTKTTQTTTSVPSSPIQPKDSASLPTSPSPKPAPSSTPQHSPPSPPKPFSTSSSPTSPVRQLPTSPVKTVTTSPVKTVPTITNTFTNGTTTTTRQPTPTPSPRTIKPAVQTPPLSPKHKPTAPPPSPLTLPPAQLKSKPELEPKIPLEAEQKGVLVQKTIETPKPRVNGTGGQKDLHESHRPHIAHHHHGKHEEHKDFEAKKKGGHHNKFSSDSEEGSLKVITIAGENKGAFMEVIKSPVKHGFDGNPQSLGRIDPKTEKGGSVWHKYGSSSSSGEEENSKKKDKSHKGKGMHSPPMDAYMNSNVQGVNNSLLFNSSCSHHDPGVHLSLSRKPIAKGFHVKDKDSSNGHHS